MEVERGSPSSAWFATAGFRNAVITILAIIALGEGYITVAHRRNDFECHLVFGRDFVEHEPYRNAGNYYPLARVMFDVMPASMNRHVARFVFYGAALLLLVGVFAFWFRLKSYGGLHPEWHWAVAGLTLTIVGPHLLRDLDEAGLQTLALFALTAGAYALVRNQHGLCGFCLAAAAAYKATPVLFLPFLLWKREWRAAGWMAGFLAAFNMAPALYLGWDGMLSANEVWWNRTTFIMANMPDAYPSIPNAEEPKVYNVGLTAFLARYLEDYPEGHPLNVDHPLYVQPGGFSTPQAKLAVKGLTFLLGAWIAWRFSGSWRTPEGAERLPCEWAVAILFAALMSPLCWKQHLVFGLPCAFLVVHDALTALAATRGQSGVHRLLLEIALIAVVFWLTRSSIIGRAGAVLCLSYKLDTIAFLFLAWRSCRFRDPGKAQTTLAVPTGMARAA
jgi:hypothetical protein